VALLVPSAGHANALIEKLVERPGFEYFNSATDTVDTWPFNTTYRVRYHFVRTTRSYRLEIMHPQYATNGNGFSPLHSAMWRPNGVPAEHQDPNFFPMVHVSYKVADDVAYRQECELLALAGAVVGQKCKSTYGHFSYWLPPDAQDLVWLKPRVNLRDGAVKR
jgi:hypothetical protein